jgi:hypothetical protein
MKRLIVVAGLLACFGLQPSLEAHRRGAKRYLKKESTVDMSAMQKVFVGWVDLGPDNWAFHRYASKEDWETDIDGINSSFSAAVRAKWLPGRTVTGAKNRGDENTAGQDLYIRFADVWIDYNNYLLYLSIHFIDPKTNAQIAAIPARPYYGNDWGFRNYLRAALEEVNRKIQVEVTGARIAK